MEVRALLVLASVAALAACSSNGNGTPATHGSSSPSGNGGTAGPPPVVDHDTVWTDGTTLDNPVVIEAGAKVTIAAGATVHAADGITITVKGTLTSQGGAQAKITGAAWSGILVASGGTMKLDGVDLENADTAIYVQQKDALATYDRGTIATPRRPFLVEPSATFTTDHAKVTAAKGISQIMGKMTATHLDYETNGVDGLTTASDDAELSVEDSTMHGGGGASDMIVSYTGAKSIHVAYTEITDVHCAFHLERVTGLDVSYVTAQADSFGFMLYGSLPDGTKSVHDMNMIGEHEYGVQEGPDAVNGPITFDGCYFGQNALGDTQLHPASQITIQNNAAAPIANAKPRS